MSTKRDEQLIVPSIVENWITELKNKKSHDFARDLYRIRLEKLRDYISRSLTRRCSI